MLADNLLQQLGINATLHINSLGSKASRENYTNELVAYLQQHESELSDDSKARLTKNPLRILDSKDANDQALLKNAPKITECLLPDDAERFETLQNNLTALNIAFTVNPHIVRGLDYYNDLVFEFISNDEEMGSQNTVLAGGRYDGLVSQMGGPETPAIGFAAGIGRLALTATLADDERSVVAILPKDANHQQAAFKHAKTLRDLGQITEIIAGGNINKRFKKANKRGADVIIVVGDELEFNAQADSDQGLLTHIKQALGA